MDARKVIITVEADTLLSHAELKQLNGLVFGKLKGKGRRTIKLKKPLGTQHDCWGLIRQVQVNVQGPSKDFDYEKPRGHPRRDDWGKPKRKTSKRRSPKRTAKAPRKPRPSELKVKEAARAAGNTPAVAAG